MADVAMPRLSDSMEEGTILKWLKSDGDEISRGDELVEIETDKANMTYEADEAGALQIVAKEGDTLAVGETIATIGGGSSKPAEDAGGEQEPAAEEAAPEEEPADDAPPPDRSDVPTAEDSAPESEQSDEEAPVATADEQVDQPAGDGNGRVKASPIARRMAAELGVELSGLTGSGPGGRIVKSDVQAAAKNGAPAEEPPAEQEEARPTEPAPEAAKPAAKSGDATTGKGETTIEELTRLQQTIARRMAESKATAPEFVLTLEVDMGEAVEFRKQLKAAAGDNPPPSFNDFVVKASALALQEFPRANGAYRDGKFELYSRINVGIAVAGQDALIVPTIFDADRKSLGEISRDARGLAGKVRDGKISPPELSGGTFSVSNLGMFGIKRFTAVINPPQAAILAVGEMTPRPVVVEGEVAVRPIMELTLSCDHRILYGADAAQFLGRIRERLENPYSLAL
ncbi:MAG: dihydrolipoamide acetyltransferase family protein [Solirubrobacteraceae bacterium]